MDLWLVRHGPTHAKRLVGRTDLPADLSDTAALGRLSAMLPDAPVLSSPLVRAVATADAVAGARPRPAPDPAWAEFDYGEWEDRPFDAFDGPLSRAFFETPGDVRPPGGESWNDVAARAGAAADRLAARHDAAVVVCHFGVILTLWARAAGVTPREALAQRIAPLSVTRLRWPHAALFVDRAP